MSYVGHQSILISVETNIRDVKHSLGAALSCSALSNWLEVDAVELSYSGVLFDYSSMTRRRFRSNRHVEDMEQSLCAVLACAMHSERMVVNADELSYAGIVSRLQHLDSIFTSVNANIQDVKRPLSAAFLCSVQGVELWLYWLGVTVDELVFSNMMPLVEDLSDGDPSATAP